MQGHLVRTEQAKLHWMIAAAILAAAIGVLVLRCFPPGQYRFYPTCPIHAVTGLLCPGCGGTRAMAALLRGDWRSALRFNALLTFGLPTGLAYGAILWRQRRRFYLSRGGWAVLWLIVVAFTLARNLA